MATVSTDSLYPPLTSALVRRAGLREPIVAVRPPVPRKDELAENARFFTMSLAGSFVFFLTWLG